MFSKNHPIVLFVDRNGFSIFQDTQSGIPRFNFTPDIVADLDVVDKDKFSSLIETFIQINKIISSGIVVILSDTIIYTKDIAKASPISSSSNKQLSVLAEDEKKAQEVQRFLANVPFEEIMAKVVSVGGLDRVVAVNKILIMTIVDVFVKKGSIIEAIIPSFIYGSGVDFTQGLNQNNIQLALGEAEITKTGNLLTNQQEVVAAHVSETERKEVSGEEKKPQNLRQYILVGVFAVLVIILVVVYLNLGVSKTSPVKKTKNSVNVVSSPTIAPTFAPATVTATPIDFASVKIKITYNSQSETAVSNLKSQLMQKGFENIVMEVLEESAPEKSSVLFSQNLSVSVRDVVITEIRKIIPNVSSLENQDFNSTITILMGKS
ncbi:MAG: hypothetical protein Q8P26_02740 [Candidatus Levybacteria bacterium]|nr:hypothetical protein [Candidatus Levybacteria bacterium]